MKRLLWPGKEQINDMTQFVVETVMSLFSMNLAIIMFIIQDIHMMLYNVLEVIDHYFRK